MQALRTPGPVLLLQLFDSVVFYSDDLVLLGNDLLELLILIQKLLQLEHGRIILLLWSPWLAAIEVRQLFAIG